MNPPVDVEQTSWWDLPPPTPRRAREVRCSGPCLDHVIVFGEDHLRRVLKGHVSYFNTSRPHQGIQQSIPARDHRGPVNATGKTVARLILGGLHHDYWRAA